MKVKKYLVSGFLAIILAVIATPALADHHRQGGNRAVGFSGGIDFGVAFKSTKSNLIGDTDNRIEALDKPTERSDEFVLLPFWYLRYGFKTGTVLHLGIPMEGKAKAEAGVSQQIRGVGNLGVSFHYYMPQKVWKDPYVTGTDRESTERKMFGSSLKYKGPVQVVYEYNVVDVDEDLVGERIEGLKRDGDIHYLSIARKFNVGGANIIIPGFKYTLADMDGECNSYNGYKGELTFMKIARRYIIRLAASGETRQYDETHPIFDKERKDTTYTAMVMLSWLQPFELERLSFNIGGRYEKSDSNIDFFDEDTIMTFVTVGYQFGEGAHGY